MNEVRYVVTPKPAVVVTPKGRVAAVLNSPCPCVQRKHA